MIKEKCDKILDLLGQSFSEDIEKIEKGNNSAARRVRKGCMKAIHMLKELRTAILEETKK